MALIKNTEELQSYIAIDVNFQQKNLLPYLQQGKTQVVRLLGKILYDALDVYNNGFEANTPEYTVLLPYAQRCLANFAVHYGLSALNVSIGPNGIGVVNTEHVSPASKDRTDTLRADLLNAAYDAMESMLEFLEDNSTDYPTWVSSEAYTKQYDVIITSAREFDEILNINRSRLKYLEWKPTMKDVEILVMAPQISIDVLNELKTQIKGGTVTAANATILPYLQKALAYITRSRMIVDLKTEYELTGTEYLMAAKKIMDNEITDYPTYAASSAYDAVTSFKRYENTETSKFFITG